MNDDTVLRDSSGNPIKYGMILCDIDPKTGKITVVHEDTFYVTKENIKNLL